MNEIFLALLAGLSIGFLGSFHCIGMCGPIALALPIHNMSGWKKYGATLLYNLGRAFTYGSLGLLFGLAGSQFRLWGLQQWVSILAGVMILIWVFSTFSFASRIRVLRNFHSGIKTSLGRLLQSPRSPSAFFSIGVMNGLLPCGLVYVAIAAALATTQPVSGAILMIAFGLGTFPVMAGLMIFGHLISLQFRQKLNRAVPVFVSIMAIILILRGLNLGIPFISPYMNTSGTAIENCHKPS